MYNKQTWESGMPLNSTNMNHIEQGIHDCSEKLDNISEDATNVTESTANGNILIDGEETNVYTLPTADSETLGGVINSTDADNMISIDENGVIKATHPVTHDATIIELDTTEFNKNLDSSVSDVQKLAEYVNSFDMSAAFARKLRNGGI